MYNENITIQRIFEESSAIGNGEGFIAPLGIKENGEIEYVDYSKINNLIVCGTSGSGKTTFVRTLLTSLMVTSSPDKVVLCIFDSKYADYMDFNGMPFLCVPIIHDSRKCLGMIYWALGEAQRRQKLLADDTDNIDDFPDLFIVLDDYAEITQHPEVQETLYSLLQIAHRVKIHVIIVTSIALAKIISTELKVNIPHRISFFLPERRNSQVVIDQDGAESLEFPGQFITKFYSKAKTFRAIKLSDLDIEKICDFFKKGTEYDEPIFKQLRDKLNLKFSESDFEESEAPLEDEDQLYNVAVQIVLEEGVVSTSFLQRKLRLGYSRAARIIDKMEEKGVIGPRDGSSPRRVLITEQQPIQEESIEELVEEVPVMEEIIEEELVEQQPTQEESIEEPVEEVPVVEETIEEELVEEQYVQEQKVNSTFDLLKNGIKKLIEKFGSN